MGTYPSYVSGYDLSWASKIFKSEQQITSPQIFKTTKRVIVTSHLHQTNKEKNGQPDWQFVVSQIHGVQEIDRIGQLELGTGK